MGHPDRAPWNDDAGTTLEERRKKHGGPRRNDDALSQRGSGCRMCGASPIYFDGMCLHCAEHMGVDGPGRDSMG